ncbi:hypothetical protein [uncultured Alteromonas sp.]|uniref:hypothetical protein n=1 Tax=uncultured Alteromonas sp. TaxID=179113 RepID=UPI0025DD9EA2|nr:hypothetical protein [uncultured Alteromonas sp.]
MNITKPLLTKSELLKLVGIPESTFNNWFIRGFIPLKELGCVKVSFTSYKYSHLTAAYCAALSYHSGRKRSKYIEVLKSVFGGIAKEGSFPEGLTIAISSMGKGQDCGAFENYGEALRYGGNMSLYVNVGKLIKGAAEHQKLFKQQCNQK